MTESDFKEVCKIHAKIFILNNELKNIERIKKRVEKYRRISAVDIRSIFTSQFDENETKIDNSAVYADILELMESHLKSELKIYEHEFECL